MFQILILRKSVITVELKLKEIDFLGLKRIFFSPLCNDSLMNVEVILQSFKQDRLLNFEIYPWW